MCCGYKDQEDVFPEFENTIEDISNISNKNKRNIRPKSNKGYKISVFKNDL